MNFYIKLYQLNNMICNIFDVHLHNAIAYKCRRCLCVTFTVWRLALNIIRNIVNMESSRNPPPLNDDLFQEDDDDNEDLFVSAYEQVSKLNNALIMFMLIFDLILLRQFIRWFNLLTHHMIFPLSQKLNLLMKNPNQQLRHHQLRRL